MPILSYLCYSKIRKSGLTITVTIVMTQAVTVELARDNNNGHINYIYIRKSTGAALIISFKTTPSDDPAETLPAKVEE